MSQEKKLLLAVAGAGALGAALYTTQGSGDKSSPNKTRDKKDMGLQGAGIAGTGAAGGNERAVDPSEDKKVKTTGAPRDELPSGGVGGGAGAGGMGDRSIELPGASRG
ncbi:hypothetical protein MY10362_008232 [Beauveria mimosiformis]